MTKGLLYLHRISMTLLELKLRREIRGVVLQPILKIQNLATAL